MFVKIYSEGKKEYNKHNGRIIQESQRCSF